MDNLPADYREPNDISHYAECEEQPQGFPCICDQIAERLHDDDINNQIDDKLQEDQV